MQKLYELAADLVRKYPGRTAQEYQPLIETNQNAAAAFSQAYRKGLIFTGEKVKRGAAVRPCVTYWPEPQLTGVEPPRPDKGSGLFRSPAMEPEHVSFELSTTGPQGGDAGHGGVAVLEIGFDCGCYQIEIERLNGQVTTLDVSAESIKSLRLVAQGDWELGSVSHGLQRLGLDIARANLEEEWSDYQ